MISTTGISACRQQNRIRLTFQSPKRGGRYGVEFITDTFKPVFHMKYKLLNSNMSIKIMSALIKNNSKPHLYQLFFYFFNSRKDFKENDHFFLSLQNMFLQKFSTITCQWS